MKKRKAQCPDPDGFPIQRIEVAFAIPTYITQEQQRRLADLVEEMARADHNTPKGHVHWQSGIGSKPLWSRADRRLLGLPDDPDAPDSGEPGWDDGVLHLTTSCRELYDDERSDSVEGTG